MKEFVHLHLHSQYSLLDSTIKLPELFEWLKSHGMNACAITDHGHLLGAADFYFLAKEHGIKPIIGCEFFVAPESRLDRDLRRDEHHHLVLLAMNRTGYENLMHLATSAYLEGYYYVPRIDKALLEERNEGLVCLSGCARGEIPSLVIRGEKGRLQQTVEWYRSVFESRFFLELQDHALAQQAVINRRLIREAARHQIPVVATNNCHYIGRDHAGAQRVLSNIGRLRQPHGADGNLHESDELYVKSPAQMEEAFSDNREALWNSLRISEMCNVALTEQANHTRQGSGNDNSPHENEKMNKDVVHSHQLLFETGEIDVPAPGSLGALQCMKNKYGDEHFANTPKFSYLRSKKLLTEMAKALSIPRPTIEAVLRGGAPSSIRETVERDPSTQKRDEPELARVVSVIDGLPDAVLTRTDLFVVSEIPLKMMIPLYRGPGGERVTQYTSIHLKRMGIGQHKRG